MDEKLDYKQTHSGSPFSKRSKKKFYLYEPQFKLYIQL